MESTRILKQTSQFVIEQIYQSPPTKIGDTKNIGTASVNLEINYKTKTFSIMPSSKNAYGDPKHFGFINNSHKWHEWKAVAAAIDKAIDFAVKELELDKDIKS